MAVDGGEVGEVIETTWNIVVVSWEMVLAVGAWVCIYYLLRGAMDAGVQTEQNEKEVRTSRPPAAQNTATADATTWRNRTAGGNKSEIQARGPSMDRTAKRARVKP